MGQNNSVPKNGVVKANKVAGCGPPTTSRCLHGYPSSMLHKTWLKRHQGDERCRLTDPCEICNVVHAFRKDYNLILGIGSPLLVEDANIYCDRNKIGKALGTPAGDATRNPTMEFRFLLKPKELGEAYHVLICCLLLRNSPSREIRIQYSRPRDADEARSIEGLQELFQWYRVQKRSFDGHSDSNAKATAVIAEAFRKSNNRENATRDRGQEDLFSLLRRLVNTDFKDLVCYKNPVKQADQLSRTYFTPSSAAKYWLNRYFRLTSRFESHANKMPEQLQNKSSAANLRSATRKSPVQQPSTPLTSARVLPELPLNPSQLPKTAEVTRMAVIHVRGSGAKTPVGRVMDSINLRHVARSIGNVNKVAEVLKHFDFSHILLYGDFDYAEVPSLVALVKEEVSPSVKVTYISSPWKSSEWKATGHAPRQAEMSKYLRAKKEQVDALWEMFRQTDSDYLPVQVKNLGIWTALCERYHPKICIVGHRSGFIEAAAFIGIPTFYLNNERDTIEQEYKTAIKPGQFLWQQKPSTNRLREVAYEMNTLISIESLQTTGGQSDNEILRVEDEFKNELGAALFIYMCNERLTKIRTAGKLSDELRYDSMPVWMSRVDILHGACDQNTLEELDFWHDYMHGETDIGGQPKQCWLRCLYNSFCAMLELSEKSEQQHLEPGQQSLGHEGVVKLVENLGLDERERHDVLNRRYRPAQRPLSRRQ